MRDALKEKVAEGDIAAIKKLERIKDQNKKFNQKRRNDQKEKVAEGDIAAIKKLERKKGEKKRMRK